MSTKLLVIFGVIAVLVIIGVAAYYLSDSRMLGTTGQVTPPPAGGVYPPAENPPAQPPTVNPPPPTQPPALGPVTVELTDNGFVPASLSIKAGQTVTFVNQSARPVWPASDPHPVHTNYPGSGGCIGSVFDACQGIPPGSSWSFTFIKTGTWGYHNHLSPGMTGIITVRP